MGFPPSSDQRTRQVFAFSGRLRATCSRECTESRRRPAPATAIFASALAWNPIANGSAMEACRRGGDDPVRGLFPLPGIGGLGFCRIWAALSSGRSRAISRSAKRILSVASEVPCEARTRRFGAAIHDAGDPQRIWDRNTGKGAGRGCRRRNADLLFSTWAGCSTRSLKQALPT